MFPDAVIERARHYVAADGDCVVSLYSCGSHGYPQIGWNDGGYQATLVHRVVWVAANGPIPPGMTVDHICRNKRCCRLDHLRLLTNLDNARDNGMSRRTHCPQGHAYDEANTYIDRRGHRKCRTCNRERRRSS